MINTLTIPFPSTATSLFVNLFYSDSSKIDTKSTTNSSPIQLPRKEWILFKENISVEWQIAQPLIVSIEHSNGLFIVSDNLFGVYGDGDNEYEALEDYKISLIDYYQLIKTRAQENKQTQELFNHLKLYISPVVY